MTWNPKLAEKATSIRITYTIKPYDVNDYQRNWLEDVTGQSFHLYNPQIREVLIMKRCGLYITVDSKTRIVVN